jgi:DNA polymerase-3 subunit delta'
MNVNAANGLLKTLEEPRKNTLIILLAHNARSLPQAILSRCQSIHINPTYEQESAQWVSKHIDKDSRTDFDALQLLESSHGVPYKALEDLKGDYFLQYQNWQNLLLEIAISPTKIYNTEIFDGNEIEVLKCLQQLLNEGIKIKILNHEGANLELNKVVEKTSNNYLFKLLDDINCAISMSQTTVNMKLLLDNVLIVWSHISHLKKYPAVTNIQEN